MLTLNIETSLQLKDDASLNAAEGVIATVFDDPNKMEVTDFTEWFSARINALKTYESITWTPHFIPTFAMLEMNQMVDLEFTTIALLRNVVSQCGLGLAQSSAPDILQHGTPVFLNVEPGDILTILSGDHAVLGDHVVSAVLDNYNIRLATPIYTGSTTVNDFIFKVTRQIPSEVITMRNVNKLCEVFMPFESLKITNVSLVVASIRSLFLG